LEKERQWLRREFEIPCFGTSGVWKVNYVYELLSTRRVLGEYQPMTAIAYKDGEKNFDPETGQILKETDGPVLHKIIYPETITPTLRERSDVTIEVRKGKNNLHNKDREYRGGGRAYNDLTNLFPSLIYDGTIDGSLFDPNQEEPENAPADRPMHQKTAAKGNGRFSPPYLLTKYEAGWKQHFIHLANLEKGVLTFFERVNWKRIAKEFETVETRQIQARLDAVKSEKRQSLGLIKDWEAETRRKSKKSGAIFDAIDK
jgi:hypothetical protein